MLYIYVCFHLRWGHLYISFEMVTQHQPELAPFGTQRLWVMAHYVTQMDHLEIHHIQVMNPYTSLYHPFLGGLYWLYLPFSAS